MNAFPILDKQSMSSPKNTIRRTLLTACILCCLTALLCLPACSHNTFPSGQWEWDNSTTMGVMVFLYNLKPDKTGIVLINPPALMMAGPSETTVAWSYNGNILTINSQSPITIGGASTNFRDVLTLVSESDSTIIWKNQEGSIIQWNKKN